VYAPPLEAITLKNTKIWQNDCSVCFLIFKTACLESGVEWNAKRMEEKENGVKCCDDMGIQNELGATHNQVSYVYWITTGKRGRRDSNRCVYSLGEYLRWTAAPPHFTYQPFLHSSPSIAFRTLSDSKTGLVKRRKK
jgi:hypothetical protein